MRYGVVLVVAIIAGVGLASFAAASAKEPGEDDNKHLFPVVTAARDTPVKGFWLKTESLMKMCMGDSEARRAYCIGYVSGVDDEATFLVDEPLHCAPRDKLAPDYADAVLSYVLLNPDSVDDPAVLTVMRALRSTWPCKPKASPQPKVKGSAL